MFNIIKYFSKTEDNKIKKKQIISVRNPNNGDLASNISPDIFEKEFLPFLDLKSLLNLRISSTELYSLVNKFFEDNPKAKELGVVALPKGSNLSVVGDNVVHRKYPKPTLFNGVEPLYGKPVSVTNDDIQKSFKLKNTFFSNEQEAKEHIKKQTKTDDWDQIIEKPYLGNVTLTDDITLAKMKKDKHGFNEQMSIQDTQEHDIKICP
ncbi:TPA: hypothetical protein JAN54_16565 [Legionella pneumophila]|nr:hypothetical protein [Legionella pneumophila]